MGYQCPPPSVGDAGKAIVVNTTEDGFELATVGGGGEHLYWHSVQLRDTFSSGWYQGKSFNAGVIILSTSDTAITSSTLIPMFTTSGAVFFAIYGGINISDTEHKQIRFFSRWSNTQVKVTDEDGNVSYFTALSEVVDAVNQIF